MLDLDWFMILSNVFLLLPPIYIAFPCFRRFGPVAVTFLAATVTSTIYHSCNANVDACFTHAHTLKALDYITSNTILWQFGVILIAGWQRTPLANLAITVLSLIGFCAIAIATALLRTYDILNLVVFGVTGATVLLYYLGRRGVPPYDQLPFLLGLVVGFVGVSLFLSELPSVLVYSRWASHSLWHFGGPLAGLCFLYAARPEIKNARPL